MALWSKGQKTALGGNQSCFFMRMFGQIGSLVGVRTIEKVAHHDIQVICEMSKCQC